MSDTGAAGLEFDYDVEAGRYRALRNGVEVSYVVSAVRAGVLTVLSTVTDPRHRGAGHAGRLTRFVLDDARRQGLRVVPRCPYTADWIERHPDYADLLT